MGRKWYFEKIVCWLGDGKQNNLLGCPKGQFLSGLINGGGGGVIIRVSLLKRNKKMFRNNEIKHI